MKGIEVYKLGRSGVERLHQGLNIVSLDVVEASILEVHHEALVAHNLKSNLLQGGALLITVLVSTVSVLLVSLGEHVSYALINGVLVETGLDAFVQSSQISIDNILLSFI